MAEEAEKQEKSSVSLPGLYAFKMGMTQVVDDKGDMVPCTVLKYEPWIVSELRTTEKNGYNSVQISCRPRKEKLSSKAQQGSLKKSGFKAGAYFSRELRTDNLEGLSLGLSLEIDQCLNKGDVVKATATSKGKGFQGVMKRWNHGGGPASHGSKFHRQPGSSGNRTWPGRIMRNKKYPGHMGDKVITTKNLKIVDVYKEDSLILVAGNVPGAKNALVRLLK